LDSSYLSWRKNKTKGGYQKDVSYIESIKIVRRKKDARERKRVLFPSTSPKRWRVLMRYR
jgi:hypothetical protein